MKSNLYQMIGVVLVGGMFYSCEPSEEPFIENEVNAVKAAESTSASSVEEEEIPDYFAAMLAEFYTTTLNTYTLEFTGRTVNGSGVSETTTFSYRVSGTGETPQLDSFNLSLPGCAGAPVSVSPIQASDISTSSVKWNQSVSKDGSQEYSITFPGNVSLGVIQSTVTRGSNVQSYSIVGPCDGVYTLTGSIYIDANGNKEKDASESGISGFIISLLNEDNEEIGTETTTADGSYSFMVLAGTYIISVGDDLLNDENYTASTPTSINIGEVAGNSSDNNFGYLVNTAKITNDLESGYYNLNTEPSKFWIQQLRNAGKRGNYSEAQINAWLIEIEGMLLSDPFNFGSNKRAAAMDILTRPIRTDLDEYLQQLLTAELNVISGRGARNGQDELNIGFNRAMLIYAEAVACREMGTCPEEGASSSAVKTQTKRVSLSDTRMIASFNGSGGI